VDGVDVIVAQTVISEVGLDMSPWKTEAHFASWLGVCPDNRISGDKVLGRTRHPVATDSCVLIGRHREFAQFDSRPWEAVPP
jgi:Transposase IS116/IS110/IS902 family